MTSDKPKKLIQIKNTPKNQVDKGASSDKLTPIRIALKIQKHQGVYLEKDRNLINIVDLGKKVNHQINRQRHP
jgi:hypothetical protein